MQKSFFKKLINILKRGWLHIKSRYKSKKVNDFSLSQREGFFYK